MKLPDIVLITRPEASAKRMAFALKQQQIEAHIDSILSIIPVIQSPIKTAPFDAVVVSSVNAMEFINNVIHDRSIPLFCAGIASKQIAETKGFTHVFCGTSYGLKEVVFLLHQQEIKKPLYLCGTVTHHNLQDLCDTVLESNAISVTSLCLYESLYHDELQQKTIERIVCGEIGSITCYSFKTAQHLVFLLQKAGLYEYAKSCSFWCLTKECANYLNDCGYEKTIVQSPKFTLDDYTHYR